MSDTDRAIARAELREVLKGMLAGQVSFIEGARTVNGLTRAAGFELASQPFATFVAIDSETDAVPVGEVRELWHLDAVAKHAAEWKRAEDWARRHGRLACREALSLVERT